LEVHGVGGITGEGDGAGRAAQEKKRGKTKKMLKKGKKLMLKVGKKGFEGSKTTR
jgi:hypothetical protein